MESEARGEVAPADEATDEASTDGISASISGAAAPVPAVPIPAVPVPPAPAPPEVNPGVAEVNSEVNSEVNPHVEVWQRRLESACRLDVNADCKKPNCKFCKTQEFKKNYIPMVNVNDVMTYVASRSRSPRRRRLGSFTVLFAGLLALRHQTCWATCGRIVKAAHTSSLWLSGKTASNGRCASSGHQPGPHLQQAVCGGRSEPRAARQAHGTYAWDTMGHAHGTCMGHAWGTMGHAHGTPWTWDNDVH